MLLPCYTETAEMVAAAGSSVLAARLPPRCSLALWILDDGRDPAKAAWAAACAARHPGAAVYYVGDRVRPEHEVNRPEHSISLPQRGENTKQQKSPTVRLAKPHLAMDRELATHHAALYGVLCYPGLYTRDSRNALGHRGSACRRCAGARAR